MMTFPLRPCYQLWCDTSSLFWDLLKKEIWNGVTALKFAWTLKYNDENNDIRRGYDDEDVYRDDSDVIDLDDVHINDVLDDNDNVDIKKSRWYRMKITIIIASFMAYVHNSSRQLFVTGPLKLMMWSDAICRFLARSKAWAIIFFSIHMTFQNVWGSQINQ